MLSKVRGSALLAEREGGNKKVSVLEKGGENWSIFSNKNSGKLPTVIHVLSFQTACKMTSHGCVVA